MTPLAQAQKLYQNATNVLVLSGAGMSVPLGTPPYYTGSKASYGGEETVYGLTVLQHVKARTWETHEEQQLAYFRDLYETFWNLRNRQNTHYHTLLNSLTNQNKNYFNVTSNVDNAFLNYGYHPDNLWELHGQTRLSQCLNYPSFHSVFPTTDPTIGEATCPQCGGPARPNALFFDDPDFNDLLESNQYSNYLKWKQTTLKNPNLLILEIGAGTTVNTIRNLGLRVHAYEHVPYIRINPQPYPSLSEERRERNIPRSKKALFVTLELPADEGISKLTK